MAKKGQEKESVAELANEAPQKESALVPVGFSEPELRVIFSVGSQAGGSAHQMIIADMKKLKSVWSRVTPFIVSLGQLQTLPTTDMDQKEIEAALEGEPISLGLKIRFGQAEEFMEILCKPEEIEKKMNGLLPIVSDYVDAFKAKLKALKKLS